MSRPLKDSGIAWIGHIPDNWKVCFAKQIMRNKSIKGYPDEQVLSLYRDYGVIPKDSRDDNHNVTSEDTSSYKFVEIGDFVINKMKAWQGSMAVSSYQGIISPAYYICRFIAHDINRRYIHYLLRNDSYKAEYMRLSSGLRVGQWDLNVENFLRIKMILPSMAEQQTIAGFLDAKCAEVDELIAVKEKMIDELKLYKQSVITEAVTKGLNPDAPMKDSSIEWIGQIPEHWITVPLKYLCTIKTGNQDTQDSVSEGIYPFYVRSPKIERSNKYTFEGESILMAGDGAGAGKIFHLADGKFGCHQRVYCMRNFNKVKREILYYLLQSTFYISIDTANTKSTVDSVRLPMLLNFPVFLFSLPEQQAIIDYLDKKCAEIDELANIKQQKIDELKEYKKSIIYEYVTGKKQVKI